VSSPADFRTALAILFALLLPAAVSAQERVRDPEDQEEAEPAKTAAKPVPPSVVGSISGHYYTQLAVDTRLDGGRELAAEWRNQLYLKVALEPSTRMRATVGGRFRHFTAVERSEGATFLLVNGDRPRHFFEADLWEAYLDLYLPGKVDLRIGNQLFHWGAADFLSPTDVLNPFDARWGPLVETDEFKIPVFAVSATWRGPGVNVTGAWIPFVVPVRAFLFGHDFALLPPRGPFPLPDLRALLSDPLSDALQRAAFEGSVPSRSFASSQGGLRVWGNAGRIDFGVSYFAGYEPYPAVSLDPDLGRAFGLAFAQSPDLPGAAALFARVAQRAAAGETVVSATYERRQVMGFDVTAPLGPLLARLDAAYAPLQTVLATVGSEPILTPVRRPAVTYSAGLEYRYEDKLFVLAQWLHLITVVRPGDKLFLLRPNYQAIYFDVRYRLLDGDLELAASGFGGVSQGDVVVSASVSYRITGRLRLTVGASIFEGSRDGPGGFWDANDFVFARLRIAF
jgi:hypothetical protein